MIDVDDYDDPAVMVPLDGPEVAEALTLLGRDLPPDVLPGRPLAAMWVPRNHSTQVLTTAGLFEVYAAHSERLVEIGTDDDLIYENTWWTGALETDRFARRLADLRPSAT